MNQIFEYPTGYGKSKLALEKAKEQNYKKLLIVIPRLVLIKNWEDEILKWGFSFETSYSTYHSLHKQDFSLYDCTIFDECHHISERCAYILSSNKCKNNILLSATINKEIRLRIQSVFSSFSWEGKSLRHAIHENKVPEPKIVGVPIKLDNTNKSELYFIGNKKLKKYTVINQKDIYKVKHRLSKEKFAIRCTQEEYIHLLNKEINYWQNKSFALEWAKFTYLKLCSDRLKVLSNWKIPCTLKLLKSLKNKRLIIFCNSIEQTAKLGITCIHSKNFDAPVLLDKFNKKEINQIAAVNQLNEGVNLSECQYGIFNNINASNVMLVQKIGRLLRHDNPILIIPYFKDTREEELFIKIKTMVK